MNAAIRTLKIATLLACVGWIAPALADVKLTTTVQKMERVASPDGSVGTRLVPADNVIPGDDVRYTITFVNDGKAAADAGSVVITNPVPENTQYIADSAFGSGTVDSVLRRRRQDVSPRQRTHCGARRCEGSGSTG